MATETDEMKNINDEKGEETVSQIQEAGGTASYLHCDVSDQDQVRQMTPKAQETYGPVSLAVNNAGIGGGGRIHEHDIAQWDQVMAVNLRGPFLMARAVLPKSSRAPTRSPSVPSAR